MKLPPTEPTVVTITDLPGERVTIRLPAAAIRHWRLDSESCELTIDRRIADELEGMLVRHSMLREHPMQGCNTSMACVMRNGCPRCRPTTVQRPEDGDR